MTSTEQVRKWRQKNRARANASSAQYKKENPYKAAYWAQKNSAKRRNIDWNFTYEKWVNWWGEDIDKRGNKHDELCMCRYEDSGSYHPDNVYKGTNRENLEFCNYRWN